MRWINENYFNLAYLTDGGVTAKICYVYQLCYLDVVVVPYGFFGSARPVLYPTAGGGGTRSTGNKKQRLLIFYEGMTMEAPAEVVFDTPPHLKAIP